MDGEILVRQGESESGRACWTKKGDDLALHPGKLTLNLNSTQMKRKSSFQTSMVGFHVHFAGYRIYDQMLSFGISKTIYNDTHENY